MSLIKKLFKKESIITEQEVIERTIKMELESFKKIDDDVKKLIVERRKKVSCDRNFTYIEQPSKSREYRTGAEA